MTESCHIPSPKKQEEHACCHQKKRFDWLLWGSLSIVLIAYVWILFAKEMEIQWLEGNYAYWQTFTGSVFELVNKMWWGLLLGIFFAGVLAKIPQQFVMSILGKGGSLSGILRATAGGVLLDLCSHGILVVGMQLYKRGASLGQVMAFLIASPWNSLSLTLILWALVGWQWTLLLLVFSMIIAVISGLFFDVLVKRKVLPQNPNHFDLPENFQFWKEAKNSWKAHSFGNGFVKDFIRTAFKESRMILRWIFLGVILAGLLRTFLSPENFETAFGPTLGGLGLTILVATILEVCSEGSTPIAADILTRAKAPGNAFAFLMTGVATDYTEIASLKETTKSWKIAFFLPLVTLPQVLLIAWLMNIF